MGMEYETKGLGAGRVHAGGVIQNSFVTLKAAGVGGGGGGVCRCVCGVGVGVERGGKGWHLFGEKGLVWGFLRTLVISNAS